MGANYTIPTAYDAKGKMERLVLKMKLPKGT